MAQALRRKTSPSRATRSKATSAWQSTDFSHHLHPFTAHHSLSKGVRMIVRAKGAYLYDSNDNKLLDAFAGLWCVNVGYGRKEIAKAAYDQLVKLPYYNTFFKTSTPPATELSKVLARIAPKQLNHVFYGLSGSDANDSIARMVRHYWNVMGKKTKKTIISRQNAYHGSTMAAASLGGMKAMHEVGDLPLPGFVHIMQPYWYGLGGDMTPDEFGLKAARALETKILELGPDNCAAFIGEPIQGAGGVIMPPKTYWPEIQRICRKYDLLLIADEVICGFGRTGNWFASEHYKIEADFMTMAKGLTSGYLPLSAIMISDRVAKVIGGEKAGEFTHGYTYSGHPASCAVALENIRILDEEGIVERVKRETGPYLAKRLKELESHPLVGQTRLLGLIGAIELVKDKAKRKPFEPVGEVGLACREHCFRIGLVMRATRDSMLISPPLVWTKSHVDEFMTLTRKALDLTLEDVRKKGWL